MVKRKIDVNKSEVLVDEACSSMGDTQTNVKKENANIQSEEDVDIPVDKECKVKINNAKVFKEGFCIYDAMLNQTNLQFNNNKFYLIQLLKDNDKDCYSVWMRWARVGKIGQTNLINFNGDLKAAKECFCKKFFEKTRNKWSEKGDFRKVEGKYDLVNIDYQKVEPPKSICKIKKAKSKITNCKLEDKLQDLLRVIFDIEAMNSAALDLHYDTDKLPLGRLSMAQVKEGYKALRMIEELLNEGRQSETNLMAACNAYYTRIPHDFGMKVPPIIRSMLDIKRELELLEALSDMKIALDLLKTGDVDMHPLDRQYLSLECDIKPLESQGELYQLLNRYLVTNHGATHNQYTLEMIDLYEVRKEVEWANFANHGNKMLLWHGSRTTNYGGILSTGLRIAPQEAPSTGHMFGKGVYFADMSSKSANYIYCTPSKTVGFLLLCEVSLGVVHELSKANSKAHKLPENTHSVKGLGTTEPDPSTWVTMEDGVIVPVGIPRDSGLAHHHHGYLLDYNEYVVYNVHQVRMRYLVKVRFHYL